MEINQEIGYVVSSQDYLLHLEGFPSARINDICVCENGSKAIITSLDGNRLTALMLSNIRPKPGEILKFSPEGIRLPLSQILLGRVINPLGRPIDGKAALPLDGPKLELEVVAPGIKDREPVETQFFTGLAINDVLLPLGKGQRELIIGDPRSRKSSYLLDIIKNQKNKGLICIYGAIGKPEIETRRFASGLEAIGAFNYSLILAANSNLPAPLIGIAPSVAFSIAEHFCQKGQDVLLILDDLAVHAKYLREISLLSMQSPGRESYPGNIFYEHAHLMERAGRFKKELGGGSITLLPVIETDLENLSNLIPTNLMSQTDGHLLFSSSLAAQGQYPALEWNRSVTRVGRQTQPLIVKLLGTKIRTTLADFKDLERYTQFDVELTEQTQIIIRQAKMIMEIFNQESGDLSEFTQINVQTIVLTLVYTNWLKGHDLEYLKSKKNRVVEIFSRNPEFRQLSQNCLEFKSLEDLISALENKSSELEKLLA